MTSILIVDNQENDNASLSRELDSQKPDWLIQTVASVNAALGLLESATIDCIVCEASVPCEDCFDLLNQVKKDYPGSVRFIVSENPKQEMISEYEQANHRVVLKSLTTAVVAEQIDRSIRLRQILSEKRLLCYMRGVKSLPSLPDIYNDMVNELSNPNSSLLNVGRVIEKDPALTATVLKVVNSAFYGLSQNVDSVAQGVALLGAHLIKNLALVAKVFSIFEGNKDNLNRLSQLSNDANTVGALANQFARHAKLPRSSVDHSQLAGLLSNIGQLIVLTIQTSHDPNTETPAGELLGAYLLNDWLMPDPIVEAVALQYESPPPADEAVTPLIVVHAVRYLQEHFTDTNDNDQHLACFDYLNSFVEDSIATNWLDAYRDFHQLSSQDDCPGNRAA
ncbi:MAG: HDOD domain-containing protein [Granulosicoccus sp.]|nr:HDOD domain-containing protein [Granulosicoccus sp.]